MKIEYSIYIVQLIAVAAVALKLLIFEHVLSVWNVNNLDTILTQLCVNIELVD